MIEQYDIITVNNQDYTVAEQLYYNNSEYLLLIEVDKNENPLPNSKIVEKIKINDGYGIKDIQDQKVLQEVQTRLIDMLNNES